MRVAPRGNLRQVRDAQHLVRLPAPGAARPASAAAPADAGVDLIKHQRAARLSEAASVRRQHDARQLAPDAIRASGLTSSPRLADRNNSTSSTPRAVHCSSPLTDRRRTSTRDFAIASSASASTSPFSSRRAASWRDAVSRPAATRNRSAACAASRSSAAMRSSPASSAASSSRSADRRAMTSLMAGPCFFFNRSSSASRLQPPAAVSAASMPAPYDQKIREVFRGAISRPRAARVRRETRIQICELPDAFPHSGQRSFNAGCSPHARRTPRWRAGPADRRSRAPSAQRPAARLAIRGVDRSISCS